MPFNIIALASGEGTTVEYLARRFASETAPIDIKTIICNRENSGVIERSRALGIRCEVIADMVKLFQFLEIEYSRINASLILLAGFNRIIPDHVVTRFSGKMINTHPSLLPCFGGKGFYGDKIHKAVIESGARISGCTVHFVSNDVDGGPIIAQAAVNIEDNDDYISLRERVKAREKPLLFESIMNLMEGKYEIRGKRVRFREWKFFPP